MRIERATGPTDEVRALIGELDRELGANYPPEQQHDLTLDAIFEPHVRFFVARLDGAAVGGGGVAAAGLRVVRLETSTEQHAAMRFYTRHGFRVCGAFEPYASMPPHTIAASVFMEKRLRAMP